MDGCYCLVSGILLPNRFISITKTLTMSSITDLSLLQHNVWLFKGCKLYRLLYRPSNFTIKKCKIHLQIWHMTLHHCKRPMKDVWLDTDSLPPSLLKSHASLLYCLYVPDLCKSLKMRSVLRTVCLHTEHTVRALIWFRGFACM